MWGNVVEVSIVWLYVLKWCLLLLYYCADVLLFPVPVRGLCFVLRILVLFLLLSLLHLVIFLV